VIGAALGAALLEGVGTWWVCWRRACRVRVRRDPLDCLSPAPNRRAVHDHILASERDGLAEPVLLVECMTVPEWLRVAIIHYKLSGGTVTPQASALADGREIVTIGINWASPTLETPKRDRLHHALEISQTDYLNAVLSSG